MTQQEARVEAREEYLRAQKAALKQLKESGADAATLQAKVDALDFEVPAGCEGQWLTLRLPARIPAEQRIGGRAWFDDLKIGRLP